MTPLDTDPVKRAQKHLAPELPKRFYKEASLAERDGACQLLLDGRPARTPAKHPLAIRHTAFADELVKEWANQKQHINPVQMPFTRLANSAIDGVASALDAVAVETSAYAQSDLLFYRAGQPDDLVALQSQHWDPVLDFFKVQYETRFLLAEGMMYLDQPAESVARISALVANYKTDPLCLAGLQVMTSLTGSVLIALAAAEGALTGHSAWAAAHVDEDWNISHWGADAEAQARRAFRRREFDVALLAAAHLSDQ
uniref:ATP12 family chaperone protein n=1 Tax=Pararhizobium sp. IMCC3301 TaxID=3067904 RepID=UPI002741047F|nr:ATP12 family protein [Pararhizobium sp. IMCC3301]